MHDVVNGYYAGEWWKFVERAFELHIIEIKRFFIYGTMHLRYKKTLILQDFDNIGWESYIIGSTIFIVRSSHISFSKGKYVILNTMHALNRSDVIVAWLDVEAGVIIQLIDIYENIQDRAVCIVSPDSHFFYSLDRNEAKSTKNYYNVHNIPIGWNSIFLARCNRNIANSM